MPFEILQVTAAYSNAVLAAILPHISDFAKTLDLPTGHPVTISQVGSFGCSPRSDHVGGRVILTNDYSFTFDQGAVVLYRSPSSYYSLQEPERIREFYGEVKIKKEQAEKIAHLALRRLGYADAELHLDHPAKITPPPRSEGKQVARYLVEWLDPGAPTVPGGFSRERTAVEVDATTGQILMLGIQTRSARRPDPKLAVRPPIVELAPKSQPVGGTKLEPVSPAYALAFLEAILPQASDFVTKAGLNVQLPLTTNDVVAQSYVCGLIEGDPKAFFYLKTGDRFVYSHGRVTEFDAHDAVRWSAPNEAPGDKPPEQFFGPVTMSANEALAVVTKTVNSVGWTQFVPELRKVPEIVPPQKFGTNYFARYFFNWWPKGEGMQIAVAEMDATTKQIKSLSISTSHGHEHLARTAKNWYFAGHFAARLTPNQSP